MATNAARKHAREAKPASALADADHDWGADVPEVQVLTDAEWWKMYDELAKELLGISGDEFGARWDRGDYDADEKYEDRDILRLSMIRIPRPT